VAAILEKNGKSIIATKLSGALILEPQVFGDSRGWFLESWSRRDMEEAGLFYDFVQDNHSFSAEKGTLRGIHFQKGVYAQAKIVRCIRGAVMDVAVDLRRGSPTFASWVSVELSAENRREFLIPRGFGHAFLTLTDDVEFCYKSDNYYHAEADRSIRYDDPGIGVDWPDMALILSEKDRNAPSLAESDVDFVYEAEGVNGGPDDAGSGGAIGAEPGDSAGEGSSGLREDEDAVDGGELHSEARR
jgi:dTDP-4-dehydrorhamnose 3,5-epimerase